MDSPRTRPYIWVSWLTTLLAETDKCQFKPWMKAHYRYAKKPGDGEFDLAKWTEQHNAMTQSRVDKLKIQGYVTKVEEENSFKLEGQSATLAGKPDIVALKPDEKRAIVIDEKSGKQRGSDRWQVFIYIMAMMRTRLKGYIIDGEVEYRGNSDFIAANEYTKEVEQKIVSITRLVGGPEKPPATPSASECRFCDILSCPDRYKEDEEDSMAQVEEF